MTDLTTARESHRACVEYVERVQRLIEKVKDFGAFIDKVADEDTSDRKAQSGHYAALASHQTQIASLLLVGDLPNILERGATHGSWVSKTIEDQLHAEWRATQPNDGDLRRGVQQQASDAQDLALRVRLFGAIEATRITEEINRSK